MTLKAISEKELTKVSGNGVIEMMFDEWISKTIGASDPSSRFIKDGRWYLHIYPDPDFLMFDSDPFPPPRFIRDATDYEIETYNAFEALKGRVPYLDFYIMKGE